MSKQRDYDRLTAPEFRQLLVEIGWPDGTAFALVYGVPEPRVQRWLSGQEDIPHAVRALLEAARVPGVPSRLMDLAHRVSRPTDKEREKRRMLAERHGNRERRDG